MMITELKRYAKMPGAIFYKVAALIVAFAILCAGTAFAAAPKSYNVDVYDTSEITRVETSKSDALEIVKKAGISISENDALDLKDFTVGSDSIIRIYRAANIKFTNIDGTVSELLFAGKVSSLLEKLGVTILEKQLLTVPLDTVVSEGMEIRLVNSFNVSVTADGIKQDLTIGEGTVSDALKSAGIVLSENDEVSPEMASPLSEGLAINVFRVEYKQRQAVESIAYEKQTVKSAEMFVGDNRVTQNGVNGTKDVVYNDKIVNGEYSLSTVLSQNIVKEAVPQITTVGTKQKIVSIAAFKNSGTPISELTAPQSLVLENGVPKNYKRVVTGKAAAYSARPGAKTASGRTVKPGHVAVNPNQFPYGTELFIVSTDGTVYGYAIAADTGGFVHQGKFTVDLFMSSNAQCRQWGARDVVIYVL